MRAPSIMHVTGEAGGEDGRNQGYYRVLQGTKGATQGTRGTAQGTKGATQGIRGATQGTRGATQGARGADPPSSTPSLPPSSAAQTGPPSPIVCTAPRPHRGDSLTDGDLLRLKNFHLSWDCLLCKRVCHDHKALVQHYQVSGNPV